MSLLDKYESKLKQKTLLEKYEEKLKASSPDKPNELLKKVEQTHKKPTFNEDAFILYTATHRQHQLEALHSTHNNDREQIIIPTGTGKTRIQIHIHIQDMIEKTRKNETGVYAIGAHRLLLCTQLMDEFQHMCIECGIPINVLYIGSARHDDKHVYDRYFDKGIDSETYSSTYTTQSDEVKAFYEKTRASNRHLIIVSTYHSFDKMACINPIDICTYDEAHTTIAEDFTGNILEVIDNIKRNYFFTATRKVYGEDKGMNDESFYGNVFGISPKKMIQAGEIVLPKIHVMMLENYEKGKVKDDNEVMLVKTVIEGFTEHKKKLKEDSAHPDNIGAKLLVSCKGSDELSLVQDNETFKKWCQENNIKVFSFSSRYGSYKDFEKEENRTQVYEDMKSLKDTDDCILLHIDILTEGIDLPSITAVMLLRHLNIAKLMQTLGRALRLLKSDRNKLYAGDMLPDERGKYTKPYAYLLLPMHFESLDASSEDMKRMIREVITTYGLPTEEFLPLEEFEALKNEYLDPVNDVREIKKKQKEYPLIHVIEDIVMEELTNTLPDDKQDKYNKLVGLLKQYGESKYA